MIKITAPKSHPRYLSLYYRDLLSEGAERGITSLQGLTAHGRGETFDYLIGENTLTFAHKAIEAAAAQLLLAKHPVISVNGNTAALVPKELVILAEAAHAQLEVNLFHASRIREKKIAAHLKWYGAKKILLPDTGRIPNISSNRKRVSSTGQAIADVVFVPLEDGDRTQALAAMGKTVITVDLNPLSRTAQTADITIVDHTNRCLPLITNKVKELAGTSGKRLRRIISLYNNKKTLSQALHHINRRLTMLSTIKRLL